MSFLMLWWNHFHDVQHVQWNKYIQLEIFNWSFFPTVKTKLLLFLISFYREETKVMGKIYEYQTEYFNVSFFMSL